MSPPEALTSFSLGLNPYRIGKNRIHLTTYRSGRLLLNEVKNGQTTCLFIFTNSDLSFYLETIHR
jgi:hypothetical protein